MSSEKNEYRLDRTAFQAMTVEDADDYQRNYLNYSVNKRLEIALYLTGIAYNFDMNNPPRLDRTIFKASKMEE